MLRDLPIDLHEDKSMKHTIAALALLTLGASALAAEMTEEQKTFYALGQIMGRQTSVFAMTAAELEMVKQGIGDAVEGRKPAVDMDVYGPKVSTLAPATFPSAWVTCSRKTRRLLK